MNKRGVASVESGYGRRLVRPLVATTLAAALWLCSLSYFDTLLPSREQPVPPPPVEMRLVELPAPVTATPARDDAQPSSSHSPARAPLQPMQAPTHSRHAAGRSPGAPRLPAPSAIASHQTQRTPEPAPPTPTRQTEPTPAATVPSRKLDASTNDSPSPSPSVARIEPASHPAQLRSQPLPALPDDLRDQAYQAVALARFVIHPDATFDVELIKPTPYPRLNAILLDALRKWRFSPAMENGHAIESQQQVRVHFDVQ